jgi:pantothenate kinase
MKLTCQQGLRHFSSIFLRNFLEKYSAKPLDSTALNRYIVGLAGPPGAGKSTVASEVVRRVNMLWSQKHAKGSGAPLPTEEIAAMLPMDGFHLYRVQLDAMEVCYLLGNTCLSFSCFPKLLTLLCL